jgi:hypothetical protein
MNNAIALVYVFDGNGSHATLFICQPSTVLSIFCANEACMNNAAANSSAKLLTDLIMECLERVIGNSVVLVCDDHVPVRIRIIYGGGKSSDFGIEKKLSLLSPFI